MPFSIGVTRLLVDKNMLYICLYSKNYISREQEQRIEQTHDFWEDQHRTAQKQVCKASCKV